MLNSVLNSLLFPFVCVCLHGTAKGLHYEVQAISTIHMIYCSQLQTTWWSSICLDSGRCPSFIRSLAKISSSSLALVFSHLYHHHSSITLIHYACVDLLNINDETINEPPINDFSNLQLKPEDNVKISLHVCIQYQNRKNEPFLLKIKKNIHLET